MLTACCATRDITGCCQDRAHKVYETLPKREMMFGKKEEGVTGIDTSSCGLSLDTFLNTEALTTSYLFDKLKSTENIENKKCNVNFISESCFTSSLYYCNPAAGAVWCVNERWMNCWMAQLDGATRICSLLLPPRCQDEW